MGYRKQTLRRLPPTARRLARLINEMESVTRRAKNLIAEMQRLELESQALAHAKGIPDRLPIRNSGRDFTVSDKELGLEE